MPTATIPLDGPFDLAGTVGPLVRGRGDPTTRLGPDELWRATRTPDGPATVHLLVRGHRLVAETWGPGGDRVLAGLPAMLGLDGGPWHIADHHRLVTDLARRSPGLRLTRTGAVLEALVPAILEQKVTGDEARRAWRLLTVRHGDPAPGPSEAGLRLPPAPAVLAALPYYAYHPFGVEQRRAEVVRAACRQAAALEALVGGTPADADARLRAIPGIGPWTSAEVAVRALGDPDAVSVGDFHLSHLVGWALAREPRADDTRMLELLEPWRGQRAQVVRLLERSGLRPPRRGPRLAPSRIASC